MKLLHRSENCIAQGALTNSKRPSCFVQGVYPSHLIYGKGCVATDETGRDYVDFITGLGTSILGYAHDEVNKAIIDRLQCGATLSLGTNEEIDCAERIKTLFTFVERVKFLKTGSEACSAAVKIARTYARNDYLYSEGYHGWHDEFTSCSPPALGIPAGARSYFCPITQHGPLPKSGVIIVEPIMTDMSEQRINWLHFLRKHCTLNGIVLIFDEVITGFRTPKFSMSNYLGIEPDLIVLGKAIANGMPLAVVGGKKEIMNCGEYFVSSTFAGETLSLVAAKKTMELLKSPKYSLEALWEKGKAWTEEFNSYWPEAISIEGYPTRGRFVGEPLARALFMQEACKAGILFGPSWFFNFPLAERKEVLSTLKDIICQIRSKRVTLQGKMPQAPFAEKIRLTSASS